MRVLSVGHAAFAATLVVVGVLCLVNGDLAGVWQPLPKGGPAHQAAAWICGFVSLVCGVGLLWRRTAALAARVLLMALLFWLMVVRALHIVFARGSQDSWSGLGETAVILACAWTLYVWLAGGWDERHLSLATGERGLFIARTLYGLALIPFGVAHFAYLKETAELVPAWLPWPVVWAEFFGGAFIVAGAAIVIGIYARLAAALSALQMGLFTLLVWAPIVAAGAKSSFQLSETILSVALTIAGWVVTESYRGRPGSRRVSQK
jgi:uncharacterized membrane protein